MNTATEARIRAERSETLSRLANRAEAAGIRIVGDTHRGIHVATDPTNPTACYTVHPDDGCSCREYHIWGRCPHWALLLSELGRIPDASDPRSDFVVIAGGRAITLRRFEHGHAA